METIIIRRPRAEEAAAIHRFFETVLRHTFRENDLDHLTETLEEEILDKRRILAEDFATGGTSRFFLLAEQDGQIVGTLEYGRSNDLLNELTQGVLRDTPEIGTMFVRPDRQRQGISLLLMRRLFEELRRRGVGHVCFDSGYPIAQTIWQRRFGPPQHLIENHWGEGSHHMIWHIGVGETLERLTATE